MLVSHCGLAVSFGYIGPCTPDRGALELRLLGHTARTEIRFPFWPNSAVGLAHIDTHTRPEFRGRTGGKLFFLILNWRISCGAVQRSGGKVTCSPTQHSLIASGARC